MHDPIGFRTSLLVSVTLCLAAAAAGAESGANKAGQAVGVPGATNDTQPLRLNADEAVRIGLARNPQIAAGTAGVASAAANYRSTAAPTPLQLGITHAEGTSTAPTLNGANSDTFIDLGHVVDTSGQRRYQAAGLKSQLNVTRFQLAETRITLEQQIRDAYWSLVAARAQQTITEESRRVVEQVHGLTQTQERAGAAPRVDVIRSGIDVANAQQALYTAQGAERNALGALNVLLARSPLAPVETADNLTETTAAPDVLPDVNDLAALQRAAAAHRPLVKSAREQVRAANYAAKQAEAARFPDLSVDYERSIQQSANSDAVVLGLQFPLLDLGSVSQSIRAARELRKQAEAQAAQSEQQVAQQVAQAFTDLVQARKLAASFRTDILAPSTNLLEMAQIGYKQGATGILPVIDAENTLRNARTGYITALLALYKARDEVLAATGGL